MSLVLMRACGVLAGVEEDKPKDEKSDLLGAAVESDTSDAESIEEEAAVAVNIRNSQQVTLHSCLLLSDDCVAGIRFT
jgi:hypothetical protein